MTKDVQDKIKACEALQGKTIADLVSMPEFLNNLAAYMAAQREDRAAIRASYDAMRKLGGAKGFKLPAHVCEKLVAMPATDFANAYLEVCSKTSRRPVAEREYIRQLGQQAYNLTVAQIVIKEFPELEPILIPKSKLN